MAVTVLIVDDHAGFRASARLLLEAQGIVVVGEADRAVDVAESVERLAPDVVLLDVGLPDEDGFSVARQLRELETPPCVVMVSSRDGDDYGPKVQESGACGFVAKSALTREAVEGFLRSWR